MSEHSLESELEGAREEYDSDCGPIWEILEEGEKKGSGVRNTVFYNEDVLPEAIAKIFYGEKIEDIREKIENTHEDYFPDAVPVVCDTTEVSNPEVSVKEENAVIVIEEYSDGSIIEENQYTDIVDKSTKFVDEMVRNGQIIDDFKTEEIHYFDDDLKYIDFEDKKAIQNWPLLHDPSTVTEVTERMALMYAQLSFDLHEEYDRDLENVKDDIANNSDVINSEVYNNKGFVPEMVGYWTYEG